MRIALAHGFTQTARSWDIVVPALRQHLGDAVELAAVDLPGHGTAGDVRAELWGCADHLVAHGGEAVYVGYSMGGRVALHAALAHPTAVQALVLIGATPGIDDEAERFARRSADRDLAARIAEIGVDAFIDEWLSLPLFAGLTDDAAMRDDRRRNRADNLASSLLLAGTGTQSPLWPRLGDIAAPTLVIVGEHDEKFTEIGERMCAGLPAAELVTIDGAGHSAHLEQPDRTAAAIGEWIARVSR